LNDIVKTGQGRGARHTVWGIGRIAGSSLVVGLLFAFLVAIYVASRLPVYMGYLVPVYAPDSTGYFDAAYRLATGQLPLFGIRTPGYPLFLFVTLGLTRYISAVIVVQQLAILLSGLSLYAALVHARRWLAFPAAIAVTGLFCAGDLVIYETSLGTEALYTACMVGIVAALLGALRSRKSGLFITCSALMAYAVMIRPAGMFLIVVFAAVLGLLWLLKYPRRCSWAFGVPLIGMMLALASYNLATLHQFTITPFGSVNVIAATATFWQDSTDYPDAMREAIHEMAALVTPEDRQLLAHSRDSAQLLQVYNKYYNQSLNKVLAAHIATDPGRPEINALLKKVAFDAIRAHPSAYATFVWANLYNWVRSASPYWLGTDLEECYKQIYGNPATAPIPATGPLREYMLREFSHPARLPNFEIRGAGEQQTVSYKVNGALEVHRYIATSIFPLFYGTKRWAPVTAALALGVMINLLRFPLVRAAPIATVVSGVALLMLAGAGLVVCLVEIGMERYATPTRFIWFLSLPLLTWLVVEWCSLASKSVALRHPMTETDVSTHNSIAA